MVDGASQGLARATRRLAGAVARFAGWRGIGAALLVASGAMIEGLTILLLIPIIATVTGAGGGRLADLLKPLAGDGRGPGLEILLAAFVVAMIGRALLLYVRDLRLAALQIDFVEDRRVRLIAALAAAYWPRVVGLRHAAMTSLLTTEVGRVAAATHHLIQGSVAATMLAGQVLLAFLLAPAIAVWLVAMLAIGVVLSLLGGSRARAIGESVVDANRALVESSGNYLGGLKIAVAQGAQPWFVAEFRAVQRRLSAQSLAFIRRTSRARMTFGVGSAMAGALVVWAGVRSGLDASVLIALIVVLARMIGPASILQQAAQNLFHAIPSFEALVAMEAGLASETPSAATIVALPEGALTLSSVAYRHPGGGGIGDVTLVLAEGEFLGITGPSGSGKTSLVDLIAGLVVPHDGTISIGGTRFDGSVRASWRSVVSYVGQDGFLFPDSVRRNLVWDLSPSDDQIGEALRLVGADRVVAGLEQGLETLVGERGARLSGGERQRLALARAVLRRPRLLILDEATSALDLASEREILTRLAALAPRPMIVIVAHRAESLALCDRIIRVEKGRVIS